MGTRFFLLSCLLITGTAQNPTPRRVRASGVPSATAPAPQIDAHHPWDNTHCDLSPEEHTELSEIASRAMQLPWSSLANCVSDGSISEAPECGALREVADFLQSKCFTPPDDLLSDSRKDNSVNNGSSWTASRDVEDSLDDTSAPKITWLARRIARLIEEDAETGDTYPPVFKPIYDYCDVLENPEEHTTCIFKILEDKLREMAPWEFEMFERAWCKKEPWIRECQKSDASPARKTSSESVTIDSDLVDEGIDESIGRHGVLPSLDDVGFLLRRRQ